jgi:NAD(P)-dependent dehydrogenase (short-subunit alcohol dehydrogenase family)
MTVTFNISPEKEAGQIEFFKRQFLSKIPPVLRRDVDLYGKTAIVTGSNSGLGLECARQLLDLGCSKVILAVRSEAKGEAARQDLSSGRDLKPDAIEVWKLDLSSYDSIIAFAERAKSLERLDLAILNAGIFKVTEVFDPTTGYDVDVQVNYLSNMLLIILLLPTLSDKKKGIKPGRIVLINSDMSGWAKFEERSASPLLPVFKRKTPKWNMSERYGTTKLLGQLFLVELTKRVASSTVTVTCCNPGMCYGTALAQREGPAIARGAFWVIQHIIGRSCSVGARTYVHAAVTLGEEAHGQYVEDTTLHP